MRLTDKSRKGTKFSSITQRILWGGLDVAMAALQRLGFSPSGVNLQNNVGVDGVSRPSGTSNRLVRFRRGFLEFLSATHDTPLADQLRLAHDRYEG